jgi:predicted nucleic acid-binding protein
MPQEIILDTSALIAFFIPSEINHEKARNYVLSHSHVRWVILETVVKALVKGLFDLINPLTIADGLPDVNSDPSYRRSVVSGFAGSYGRAAKRNQRSKMKALKNYQRSPSG